ncbi:MAG: RIP metalloprotease RseP [Elusimicrobiota bacterium]|nr:RIP metalloprotease RseP [Elusimicrobiota bacterium]
MLLTIFSIVFTFGLVIFFHELGHLIAAKRMGVRVEKFSLGFGPEWLGFTKGGTRYVVSLIPVGGYVKMAGEHPGEKRKGTADEFLSQKWWRRILIVASGPAMNFILAIVIFSLMAFFVGIMIPHYESTEVGSVIPEMPAEKAGVLEKDKIISIDGKEVNNWNEMAEIIHSQPGEEISVKILRGKEEILLKIIPQYDEVRGVGLIGIGPAWHTRRYNFISSIFAGFQQTAFLIVLTLKYIWLMLLGAVKPAVTGPVGIAQMVAQVARTGVYQLLSLIAVISAEIGLFNLFPIPLLDGGHATFYLVEGITGKPLDEKKMRIAQTIGAAIIVFLLVLVTYQDILKLGK